MEKPISDGVIEDIRAIDGTALTEEEVKAVYQRESAGEPIDDEIPAGTLVDAEPTSMTHPPSSPRAILTALREHLWPKCDECTKLLAQLDAALIAREQEQDYLREDKRVGGVAMWAALDVVKAQIGGFANWPEALKQAFSEAIIDHRPPTDADIRRTRELFPEHVAPLPDPPKEP